MNETFLVGTLFDCTLNENYNELYQRSTIWKQTMFGCRVLRILQDMFHFNVIYVIQDENIDLINELAHYNNDTIDVFARPLSLRTDLIKIMYPIHDLLDWNFGFTIFNHEVFLSGHSIYSEPFSYTLWFCLYVMAIFCSILFYFFKWSEIRLVSGVHTDRSFTYELLMVIGAYCQHIPPIDAVLYSRRGAYFAFLMFAFVVYSYYTSNLLSHLVNDKDIHIDAVTILNSDFECVILEDVMWIINNNIVASNMGAIYNKVFNMKPVTAIEGLEAIKNGKTALLSDYVTLEPLARAVFESYEICGLYKIDMVSNLRKYFYVSLEFKYKEEFKVAFLRMKEAGLLKRNDHFFHHLIECDPSTHVQTQFSQIMSPLGLLLTTYVVCVFVLIGEILQSKRNKLWPYVN